MGCEVRRIGFDQQSIEWNLFGNRADVSRIFVCQHPGEANVHAEIEAFFGGICRSGKRVHDADDLALPVVLAKRLKDILFAFSHVNDQWQAGFMREFNVLCEPFFLNLERAVVPVSVESRFSERDNLFVLGELLDFFPVVTVRVVSVVGVYSDGCVNAVMTRRQVHTGVAGT